MEYTLATCPIFQDHLTHLVRMNLVPHSDLLDRLVPAQRLQRHLRLEVSAEPSSCAHCVSLPKSVEYTLVTCPIFQDHLKDWLFDTTADPERREAEARFVHGHWLKPGDVARTEWRARCAQPPYDALPVARATIPAGLVLSREGNSWIREDRIKHVALPVYQGIMIQPFVPSARGWLSGTGLRAKWDYSLLGNLRWNPHYLMALQQVPGRDHPARSLKIGFRDVSRDSDVRSFMGAMLPNFPCGNSAPVLYTDGAVIGLEPLMAGFLNSFVFDWQIRRRGGAAHLNWYMLSDMALPLPNVSPTTRTVAALMSRLNLHFPTYAPYKVTNELEGIDALTVGERNRLRPTIDAIAAAAYGCDTAGLKHILLDIDLNTAALNRRNRDLDVRGFWRVDRRMEPELRHTVLTLVAFHDLKAKIDAAGGDCEKGIETFLAQNHGEGWMLPETLRLSDYGLGHDDRAIEPQAVASRLGPRFYDWQFVQSAEESWRECHLHARNLLGAHGYALLIVDLIERRAAEGEDYLDLLTDSFVHGLTGRDGYVTILFEILFRKVLYDNAYWNLVTDLCNRGCLDPDGCGQLIDRLHARKLIDDLEYRRWTGREAPASASELLPRVAEPESDYNANPRQRGEQKDLFK